MVRLKQELDLQKTMAVVLSQNPSFRPPTALFSEDTSWLSPALGQEGKKGKKVAGKGKKGGKGKKSKPAETDTMMNATMNLNTQAARHRPLNHMLTPWC